MASVASGASEEHVESQRPRAAASAASGAYVQEGKGSESEESVEFASPPPPLMPLRKRPRAAASAAAGGYVQEGMESEESVVVLTEFKPPPVMPRWKRPRAAASAASGAYVQEVQGSESEESVEFAPPPPPWRPLQKRPRAAASAVSGACVQEGMGSEESVDRPRPEASATSRAATGPAKLGDWICKACGNLNFNRRGFCGGRRGACGQSRERNFKPGDWYCSCGNHNMAFRTHCSRTKCGLPREQGEQR